MDRILKASYGDRNQQEVNRKPVNPAQAAQVKAEFKARRASAGPREVRLVLGVGAMLNMQHVAGTSLGLLTAQLLHTPSLPSSQLPTPQPGNPSGPALWNPKLHGEPVGSSPRGHSHSWCGPRRGKRGERRQASCSLGCCDLQAPPTAVTEGSRPRSPSQ